MPKKTFLNGYPLPASDLNTYLMDQSVMTFASDSARTSALPAPTEGMTTYLEDLNQVQVYNGTSWEGLVTTTNVGTLAPQGNAVINGGFDIWQRGTSIAVPNALTYLADRFCAYPPAGVWTVSRQASDLTASQYSMRVQRNAGSTNILGTTFAQSIESANAIPYAGKTITFSFYAKAGANYSAASMNLVSQIVAGTGTNQNVINGFTGTTFVSQSNTLTTSWQRFNVSYNVPSTATEIGVTFQSTPTGTAGANDWFEVTGVQLEAGSVATPFKRNAPSVQAELAACQRYYVRWTAGDVYSPYGLGSAQSATLGLINLVHPVEMRTSPTSVEFSTLTLYDANITHGVTAISLAYKDNKVTSIYATTSSLTAFRPYFLLSNNSTSGYVALSAEL